MANAPSRQEQCSGDTDDSEPFVESAKTIRLAERRVFSDSFKPLYNEGMGLVEQAAEYLDGPGRVEAKGCRASPRRSTPPSRCA